MPSVDPKPNNRPFRRVLYREDSQDPTVVKDVSPRGGGHIIKKTSRKPNERGMNDDHSTVMTHTSRSILIKEGVLYKSPPEKIKYVKYVRNDPMGRYIFHMQKYVNSRLGMASTTSNLDIL